MTLDYNNNRNIHACMQYKIVITIIILLLIVPEKLFFSGNKVSGMGCFSSAGF
jgi:hypothetical protein